MVNNEPMTAARRAAIKARCDAATPGPWVVSSEYASGVDLGYKPDHERTWGYGCSNDFVCDLNDGEYHEYNSQDEQRANAEFIAHARQDIPDLLAEVERLRAREEWLIGHLAEGDAYEWRCPNVKDEPWPWATCDSCNAGSVESRKRCWRKAAEMETREKQGESGEVPENPGGIRPCPECGSPAEIDNSPWDKNTPFFVVCTNKRCLACGPNAESKEKAIEAWNNQ